MLSPPALPVDPTPIIVTASRIPQPVTQSPASVTVIDAVRIRRLGEPLVPALLRLLPSTAVATSGPSGSLTEVRIRGAEANHTLLFIDGIHANDPAAGDVPRFELLNADLTSRIEEVRGPQSALWGSEAIGGVIAVDASGADATPLSSTVEAGSFGFHRAALASSLASSSASVSGAVGWQRARGIDSFNGRGDRDGYRNLSARLSAQWSPAPAVAIGVSGFALTGKSEFDGFDPLTFAHADTLDNSRNRLAAARAWARFGEADSAWSGSASGAALRSSNRNYLADTQLNRTSGGRDTIAGQVEHRFEVGGIANRVIAAVEHERETFAARDVIYGGSTDQNRRRNHDSLTLEWRAQTRPVTADLAVRNDRFDQFRNATTTRASLLAPIIGGFALAASYGEGIAQPTFFDLYGFFPGSFVGNPLLRPESSHGVEVGARFRRNTLSASLTWYRQDLRHEIVDVFDPVTFISSTTNRSDSSRREGVEAEIAWSISDRLRLSANYAYLDATQPGSVPDIRLREVRRPKHSGSVALDGATGKFSYGASMAYSGARTDTSFDSFPAQTVRLHPYWLAGARLAYDLRPSVQLFARTSNAFGAHYQDVVGYRTEGRGIYAGIRLAGRR